MLGKTMVRKLNVNLSKREFAKGVTATLGGFVASEFLKGCAFDPNISKPDWNKWSDGIPNDFDAHLTGEGRSGNFDLGGEDYKLSHGVPIVSPFDGRVIWARYSSSSGDFIIIDYDLLIFDVWHGPEEKLFSSEGKDIERTHILMTQGMGGSKTIGGSHVHITVGEFEAINDHPKVRQLDYNSRFDRKRYSYDPNF